MSLKPMYNGKAFSPMAALVNNISAAETVIEVTDITVFPPAPNFATIGIDENAETIEYSQIAGNTLSGCIRGIEGVAKGWGADTLIARNWTNEDYLRLIENIESKVEKGQDGNADFIVFNDGDTFQEKFDNGDLVGQTGSQGIQGIDGKSVEIRNNNTYIQWRNIGDTVWNNIIALIDLKGPKGDKGDFADIAVDGILKGASGTLVAAVAGTDYATPTNVTTGINTHNSAADAHSGLFNNKLDKSGGTLTGALILAGNATQALQSVPLQQLNSAIQTAIIDSWGGAY